MPAKAKATARTYCDMIDGKMICKYCQKDVEGGGINKSKQHLAVIVGHVKPCGATNEVIGHIRVEFLQKFETQVTGPVEKFVTQAVAKFGSRDSTKFDHDEKFQLSKFQVIILITNIIYVDL